MTPRVLALGAYALLVLLQPAWYLAWHPPASLPAGWSALIMLLPLLPALPGIVRDRPRTYLWGGYVVVFYFMHGIVVAMTDAAARAPGLLEVALAAVYFIATVWRLRRPGAPVAPGR